jgi:ribose transport system substrate-binding protein
MLILYNQIRQGHLIEGGHMKKVILIGLLMLSACSSSSETATKKEDFSYFVFATPLSEHEIWLDAKVGFMDACDDYDLKCDWIGPTTIDTDAMEEVMDVAIAQHADAIITQGVVSPEIINKANSSSIPVVLVDSDIENSERYLYYGKNFSDQAELFLEDVERQVGKDKYLNVAIQVAEIDFEIATQQIEELKKVFEKHPGGFQIVKTTESKSDSVRAKREWEYTLQEADIDVAINFAGESAISCGEVAQAMGIRDSILIYGVDNMSVTIDGIAEGKIDGSVITSFYNYGYDSVTMLYDYLNNGKVESEKKKSVQLKMINQENVDEYLSEQDEKAK